MFEDLKANLRLLEIAEDIYAEDLLDSMCTLFDEAGNGGENVRDMIEYGFSLLNLFDRIMPTFQKEVENLQALKDEDIEEAIMKLKGINDGLNQMRISRESRATYQNLKVLAGEKMEENLSDLKATCEQLSSMNIDKLREKDIGEINKKISEIEKKHNELKQERQIRQNKLKEIDAECRKDYTQFEQELDNFKSRLEADETIIEYYNEHDIKSVETIFENVSEYLKEAEEQICKFIEAKQRKMKEIEKEVAGS